MGIKFLACFSGGSSRELMKLMALLDDTVSRIADLRNKRTSNCAQAEEDVKQFLLLNQRDKALHRVEWVIRERNMLDALEMVQNYCNLLKEQEFLLHNQTECPEQLREAAAGLTFASSRCGYLPELRKIRRIFSSMFGREFTSAAQELRNSCGVDREIVHKLSTNKPTLEIKEKFINDIIASAKGIKGELAGPTLETVESHNTTLEPPFIAYDPHELLGDEKLVNLIPEKYNDAGSAIQAAYIAAEHSTAAVKTAMELYRSESEKRDSSKPYKMKHISHADNSLPSTSRCSSIDLGCRTRKVSSLPSDLEKQKGKEILNEIDDIDIDKELVRLSYKRFPSMRWQ